MGSLYLNGLSTQQRDELVKRLHESQKGLCFICEKAIDLTLHADAIDIDHVEPLKVGGSDDPSNFALTHSSCNRSKQASDLRVARVLAKFDTIREKCAADSRGANLSDVLNEYGGAKEQLGFQIKDGIIQYTFAGVGDNEIRGVPLYTDELSGFKYFFAKIPIAYLHHDDRINPRDIGGYLARLVEEFHKGRPQLHVALAWLSTETAASPVKVFDGQHKATAQVLLGVKELPLRVFVDPDLDLLLTTNTNAGTTLRQVAFDKSTQRSLGSKLFLDRLDRFRKDRNLPSDAQNFSERDLIQHFKGESREMKRYVLDSARDAITHNPENRLKEFIDFAGKGVEKPLSYSTIEKSFYSFFIYPDAIDTPLDYDAHEGMNPRDIEIAQVVKLMNVIADEIYVGKFDPVLGTYRIENKVQKGTDIPEPHLRAFRMSKEEILYVWLRFVRQIAQNYFNFMGVPIDEKKLFQYPFPEPLWDRLTAYMSNLSKLPVWMNRELSATVFGGKQNYDFWQKIFETGKSPQGHQVLAQPINLMEMIKE